MQGATQVSLHEQMVWLGASEVYQQVFLGEGQLLDLLQRRMKDVLRGQLEEQRALFRES